MEALLDRLKRGEVLVADGALGTELIRRGLVLGECPEQTNLHSPGILEEIARAYLAAGADIVQTNTFGASPLRLAHYGLDDCTEEINTTAVSATRKAIDNNAYLAVSCGPCGLQLSESGEANPNTVLNGFERQLRCCVAEGVDVICIETMTDLVEASLAVRAAKTVAPTIPVAAMMTFEPTPDGFLTIMGVSIEQAAVGLTEAGADVIGSNCGDGIDNMIRIASEFREYTSLPIIIQSNAGLPQIQGDQAIYPDTPEFMAERCSQLLAGGVSIIGGCCGTTPDHIAAMCRVVDEYNVSKR
ncbi:MAG: homocysteine S-methyltransferase family protein [candidate division Zixibacteria bacterium]|nr:homocysteine S-methyltransferase family protein [candidate division Zixibacteria bacterium]